VKAAELRTRDDATLRQEIQDAREEMFNLRFQLATGKSVNISRIKLLRRDIARRYTILTERKQDQLG